MHRIGLGAFITLLVLTSVLNFSTVNAQGSWEMVGFGAVNFSKVFFLNSNDGWTVASVGDLFHWDGESLNGAKIPIGFSVSSIYMLSSNDGWAVGGHYDTRIIHWDGISWNKVECPTEAELYSVFMVDSNDGWAVGRGTIIHWDGQSWNNVTTPQISTEWTLDSIYMIDANDGWAVGMHADVAFHWNGTSWNVVEIPMQMGVVSMTGTNDGWAVPPLWAEFFKGKAMRWDGESWNIWTLPADEWFTSIFMVDSNDGWAVGYGGTIVHWNGQAWSVVPSPTERHLHSVFMVNSSYGWACGDAGSIIRYSAESTTPPPTSPSPTTPSPTSPTPTPTPESGCIIATASYGSDLAPEVSYMRYVRDQMIGSNYVGMLLVNGWNGFYYSWSPPVANMISSSDMLQTTFRTLLLPLVAIIHSTAFIYSAIAPLSLASASVLAFTFAGIMSIIIYIIFPLLSLRVASNKICLLRRSNVTNVHG